MLIRELNHISQRLLSSLRLVLVELQGAVLRGKVQKVGGVAGVASLALVVLMQAAGVHLEDDDVGERGVGQGGLAGDIADALGGVGEVGAQPVRDELDFDLPAAGVAVQNDAGLFDERRDGVADDFLLDAAGRGGLADDKVDALLRIRDLVNRVGN